jgi:hypothetical protein
LTSRPVVVSGASDPSGALLVSLRHGDAGHRMRIAASVPLFSERADALVPLGLMAAMSARAPLVLEGPVSRRLLGRLDRIQDIVQAFSGGTLARVPVDAAPADPDLGVATGDGTGSFHSCGVDSLYTVVRHRDELSHLVFMQGLGPFEIDPRRGVARLGHARTLAAEWGKELIEVELDVYDATLRFTSWMLGHGLVLAAVALSLQGALRRLYWPAGQSYRDLFPLLTHPLLDPLWSTETLDIEHDGCEATRVAKVQVLAGSPPALEHLSVCNKQHAVVNCGTCEKCVRTMTSLYFAGALDRCPTLPDTLPPSTVARVGAVGAKGRANWREPAATALRRRDWRMYLAIRWATRPRPFLPASIAAQRWLAAVRR